MTIPFHIVDVFTDRPYAGNQLAVVDATTGLSADAMQAIAREFDFSETTFIESTTPTENGYPVRIFTPETELPFAGHPTLGTAAVLRDQYLEDPPGSLPLSLPVGTVPVTETEGTLWMQQQSPTFSKQLPKAPAAAALGLDSTAVDPEYPVEVVSTGLPAAIIPLVGADALTKSAVDHTAYDSFVSEYGPELLLAFTTETQTEAADVAVRVFAPGHGVIEDPATGSANGCLAAYLAAHEYFETTTLSIIAEQGHLLSRPSQLQLTATVTDAEQSVAVGGAVSAVATGTLTTPPDG